MAKKFKTIYDRERVVSNPGSRIALDYVSEYDEDGKRYLKVKGEYSLYDEIQSYKDACDLQSILKRYVNSGDPEVLNRRKAVYADVVDIPTNYADVLRLHDAAENMFSALSIEQRELFNNNPDEFLASFGTEKFNNIINPPKVEEPIVIDDPIGPIAKE